MVSFPFCEKKFFLLDSTAAVGFSIVSRRKSENEKMVDDTDGRFVDDQRLQHDSVSAGNGIDEGGNLYGHGRWLWRKSIDFS